jgi:hypothetical protein
MLAPCRHAYRRQEPWVTTGFALRMFDADRRRAIAAYEAFLSAAPARSPLLDRNERDPRILGSDAFAQRVLGDNWMPRPGSAFHKVIDDACARFGVTEAELQSSSRLSNIARARAWMAHEALGAGIASVSSLACYFNRDASSIRQALQRHRSEP